MHLSSLQLNNFRNYTHLSIEFSPFLNVVYGDNAQGKTNLLEAIHLLATARSHRTANEHELIKNNEKSLAIKASVERRTGSLLLELTCSVDSRKQLKINGAPEKKIAKLLGSLAIVFFSPDDLQMVKGAPAVRRRFLDVELSQLSQLYVHHLITYNKILSQRNAVLKSTQPDLGLLAVLDEQLLQTGAYLIHRRMEAIYRLNPIAQRFHHLLSEGKEELRLEYQSSGLDCELTDTPHHIAEKMATLLHRRRSDELRRQVTLVGPHRDDIGFWINGWNARQYCSQGQQRTAVLALKLAELDFMSAELGEHPVLILDDVASELDPTRRNYLLQAVRGGIQTFITCTDMEDLMVRSWPEQHRLFRVRGGAIEVDERGLA